MGKCMSIFVCVLILALDINAAVFGWKADKAQNQVQHMKLWMFEYKKPCQVAYALGLASACLLVISHVLANFVGGCNVCTRVVGNEEASSTKSLSIACLGVTWISLGCGLWFLANGVLSIRKSRASCGFSHHHYLHKGGTMCILHAIFALAYYVAAAAIHHEDD
ncbi:protein DESIGUAL 3-like [Salvia divinorum]|uniref:Protein DESIGUAL 3-like n=1 Tax=Salvia divinorum TaxID=28513 RepID=A0ABD1HGH2_SALDI